jgi:hypothetical protein
MKKLNLLYRILFIVLWIDLVMIAECFSQSKGDNTIIVTPAKYSQVIETCYRHNIFIQYQDTLNQAIFTQPQSDDFGSTWYYNILVRNDSAFISGVYQLSKVAAGMFAGIDTGRQPIAFVGWRTGSPRVFFSYMTKFASLLGPITFKKI